MSARLTRSAKKIVNNDIGPLLAPLPFILLSRDARHPRIPAAVRGHRRVGCNFSTSFPRARACVRPTSAAAAAADRRTLFSEIVPPDIPRRGPSTEPPVAELARAPHRKSRGCVLRLWQIVAVGVVCWRLIAQLEMRSIFDINFFIEKGISNPLICVIKILREKLHDSCVVF